MAQLPGWLREDLASLPPAVAAAGAPTEEACCKAALERMQIGGEAFAHALVDALVRDGEAAGKLQPALEPEARPGPRRELRLVDLDVAEEDAMLAAIARRLAGSASLSLLLLGQRFAVLLARPPLDPAALPLGPRAFCDALAEATARLEPCAHARLALYRRFDLDGMALYARFAEAVDNALDDAGILRGMSFVPLQRQSHVALTVAQATERDALQALGRAAEALQPESGLAPGALRGRRDAMAARAPARRPAGFRPLRCIRSTGSSRGRGA